MFYYTIVMYNLLSIPTNNLSTQIWRNHKLDPILQLQLVRELRTYTLFPKILLEVPKRFPRQSVLSLLSNAVLEANDRRFDEWKGL